jgi:predicted aspartyl protease
MPKGSFIIILILSQLFNRTFAIEAIPFEIIGNLIVVSMQVDDKIGNYILDTGVPVVILNEKYFEGKKSEKVMQGINGQGGAVATRYCGIVLGENQWKGVYAEVTSLEALETALNRTIHGLIGCQLFRRHRIEFDYKNGLLRLTKSNQKKAAKNQIAITGSNAKTYKCKGKVPVIRATIGSVSLNLIIDTGSAYNILRKKDLGKLASNTIKWDHQRLVGLGKGELKVQAGTVFDLQVGEKICEPMKTLFSDDGHMQMLCPGQSVDGILGYEYLKQVTMTIDFKKNTVAFHDHDDLLKNRIAKK